MRESTQAFSPETDSQVPALDYKNFANFVQAELESIRRLIESNVRHIEQDLKAVSDSENETPEHASARSLFPLKQQLLAILARLQFEDRASQQISQLSELLGACLDERLTIEQARARLYLGDTEKRFDAVISGNFDPADIDSNSRNENGRPVGGHSVEIELF